jgi:hypothetical protein
MTIVENLDLAWELPR